MANKPPSQTLNRSAVVDPAGSRGTRPPPPQRTRAPSKTWVRLSVLIPCSAEEPVTAAFLQEEMAGRATGVVVEDSHVGVLTTDGEPIDAGRLRLSTYTSPPEAEAVAATLRARLERLVALGLLDQAPEIRQAKVDDEDWRDRFKEFFDVVRVGHRLVVRPPWRSFTPEPEDIVLTIEPGMAFGTGGHQTTQLCLTALERAFDCPSPPREILDVGCGSGVLSIAALCLAAERAVALDVDPAALEATEENAVLNAVSSRLEVSLTPVFELARTDRIFPLVVANIISSTLLELKSALRAVVAPGGIIILSGLLCQEEQEFRTTFEHDPLEQNRSWLELERRDTMDEWLALSYRCHREKR